MSTRRTVIQHIALVAAAAPLPARLEGLGPSRGAPRFGMFTGDTPALIDAFLAELGELGFVDGHEVRIERRVLRERTDGPRMARELASLPLEFVVVAALPFALMVRNANPDMPMVIAACPGMISNGFARCFEHPGGIYTGVDELPPGVTVRRLQLLLVAAPTARHIAVLSTTPGVGGYEAQLGEAKQAADQLGLSVEPYRASTPEEVDTALAAIARDRKDALLNFQGGLSLLRRQVIADFAAKQRIPAMYQATMFVDAGGLMSWAPDLFEQQRISARMVARILRGAKPGELPVVYAPNYSLSINTGAAKKLGLMLPPALLSQAAHVVE